MGFGGDMFRSATGLNAGMARNDKSRPEVNSDGFK